MTITETGRRIALVVLAALIAALMPVSPASAEHLTGVTQLTADDNVGASLAWSQAAAFPEAGLIADPPTRDPEYVLIGRDDIFPDNLASGALQGSGELGEAGNGPLLLTDTDTLNQDVVEEIERLGVDRAIILGETAAISEAVEDQLGDLVAQVDRLGGPSRIETAIEVTRESGATTAILARAFDAQGGDTSAAFADSLAAGGWAADAGYGVLLTQTEVLTGNVAAFLAEGQIDEVIIVGGTSAVSGDVQAQVEAIDGVTVRRVEGPNRAGTAVEIAAERGFVTDPDTGTDTDGVILVEGYLENSWASGFPSAATSALEDYPIVLSNGDGLPPETEQFATEVDSGTAEGDNADLVCGPLMPGAGQDDDGDHTTSDRAPACEAFAEAARTPTATSGSVVSVDTESNSFDIVTADDSPEPNRETIRYADDDTFTVDGEDATVEEFEEALTEGDEVDVAATASGDLTIDLTNVDCTIAVPPPIGCIE